jgi:protein TonB
MFDKLIESDSVGADFKSRRRYFLVSSLVVGALFISAVVISIYAADIDLGNDNFELSMMIAPVDLPPSAPEPPRPEQRPNTAAAATNDAPTRVIKQQPIDAPPIETPPISVTQNKYLSWNPGVTKLGPSDTEGSQFGQIGDKTTGSSSSGGDVGTKTDSVKSDPPPPPIVDRPKPPTQSLGVINGKATSLPKPAYPATAVAMHVEGKVDVQVTIDEDGKVISAKAASGNVLLREAAEKAAWQARFSTTYLSKVPVKVTGVIVYNFTRN